MMMRCNDDDAIGRSVAMASHSKEEIFRLFNVRYPVLSRLFNTRYPVFLAVKHAGWKLTVVSIF